MSGELLSIITGSITTAGAIVGWFITIAKNKKKAKLIKVAKLLQKLPEIIKSVEECCNGEHTGTIKKLLVLNQCNIECQNLGIDYKEEEWSAEIEKILDTPQKHKKEE